MRKIFLLTILLFQLNFVFGQNSQWGSWTTISCFSSLSFSVLGNGYVPSINEYSWQVRIKSSYTKKVTFNMTWIVGGERLSIGQVTLNPGESYGHTPRYFKSSSNNIYVEVDKVCFEGQDCYKNGYADCSGNQVLNTTSNTTNNTTNHSENKSTSNNSQINDKYSKGVPKEYTGSMAINFDFKTLFKYLTNDTTLEEVKQLFLNSGFKLCENCFQGKDYVTLSKNNESFTIRLKDEYGGGKRISIQIPKVCPNLISLFQSWINTSELIPFKKKTFGLHYVYESKYDLWTSNNTTSQDVDWTWITLSTWDVKDFKIETGQYQEQSKVEQKKSSKNNDKISNGAEDTAVVEKNKTIYTHTNGSQYYINKNGNKVFITNEETENLKKKEVVNNNSTENFNVITPQKLLETLKIKEANKLDIFKAYFIQEGYEFEGEGQCKSFFDGVLKCLNFSNFSIYQNKKGMLGISFGGNSVLMKEIKDKLNAIESTFIENEFHDGGKIVECDITFNQGKLLFYMK